jgi:hypothetical protein
MVEKRERLEEGYEEKFVALVGVRIMALAFGVWCCRWVLLVI